jgi:acyl carrier protein
MSMDDAWRARTLKSLETIFRELFLDESIRLSETSSPADIDEWDSMAHVTLLSMVERAFGVRFTAEDMGSIQDVSGLIDTLHERGAK